VSRLFLGGGEVGAATQTVRAFIGAEITGALPATRFEIIPKSTPNLAVAIGSSSKFITIADVEAAIDASTGIVGNISDMCWAPSLGLLCAAGANGNTYTSPDRIHWTEHTTPLTGQGFNTIDWSPVRGRFVAAGYMGYGAVSTDGVTWASQRINAYNLYTGAVRWSAKLGMFLGGNTTGTLSYSTTGLSPWNFTNNALGSEHIICIAVSTVAALAVIAGNAGRISTSTNGSGWTARTSNLPGPARSAAHSPTQNMFCVVGDGGGITTSNSTATTWTARVNPLGTANMKRVVWWTGGARFLATDGVSIIQSTDGVTWTLFDVLAGTSIQAMTDAPALPMPAAGALVHGGDRYAIA